MILAKHHTLIKLRSLKWKNKQTKQKKPQNKKNLHSRRLNSIIFQRCNRTNPKLSVFHFTWNSAISVQKPIYVVQCKAQAQTRKTTVYSGWAILARTIFSEEYFWLNCLCLCHTLKFYVSVNVVKWFLWKYSEGMSNDKQGLVDGQLKRPCMTGVSSPLCLLELTNSCSSCMGTLKIFQCLAL